MSKPTFHPKGDAANVLKVLRRGETYAAGHPKIERALAVLDRAGMILLFPRPTLTLKGYKEYDKYKELERECVE